MNPDEPTNWGLIARLSSLRGTEEDWRTFDGIYRGLIRAMASHSGLAPEEIQDVEQETMRTIWKKMSRSVPDFRAEAEYGSFRAWLRQVVRFRIQDQFRKRLPATQQQADARDDTVRTSTVERIPDAREEEWEGAFDRELHRQLYNRALESLRASLNPLHFQIFDYYVLRDMPVEKVARSLEVGESLIYTTKNRVMKRLAKDMTRLEKEMTRTLHPTPVADSDRPKLHG